MTSHGTNYVPKEHLDFSQHNPYAIPSLIRDNIVIQLSCKFQESNWNPDWVIALMSSFETNYILNDDKDLDQYDRYSMPSQIMACYSYPENLMNQNEILIELPC